MKRKGRAHLLDGGFWIGVVGVLMSIALFIAAVVFFFAVGGDERGKRLTSAVLVALMICHLSARALRSIATSRDLRAKSTEERVKLFAQTLDASKNYPHRFWLPAWSGALWAAWMAGEIDRLRQIVQFMSELPAATRAHPEFIQLEPTALAFQALSEVMLGDVGSATATLAKYDARIAERPTAGIDPTNSVAAIAAVARGWIHFRRGELEQAASVARAHRAIIAGQDARLRHLASALRRCASPPGHRDEAHYRALRASALDAMALLSEVHPTLSLPTNNNSNNANASALLDAKTKLKPLPLPGPHERPIDYARWATWAIVLACGAATWLAIRSQIPVLMVFALIVAPAVAYQRWIVNAPSNELANDRAALARALNEEANAGFAGNHSALETIADKRRGLVAAEAAYRLGILAEHEGDAERAARWLDHSLATLHDLSVVEFGVLAARVFALTERTVLLAARGRHEDAERSLQLFPTAEDAFIPRWCCRIIRAIQEERTEDARTLALAAPHEALSEYSALLRDVVLARDDASLASALQEQLSDWPAGLGFLRIVAPNEAERFATRVRVDRDEPGDSAVAPVETAAEPALTEPAAR